MIGNRGDSCATEVSAESDLQPKSVFPFGGGGDSLEGDDTAHTQGKSRNISRSISKAMADAVMDSCRLPDSPYGMQHRQHVLSSISFGVRKTFSMGRLFPLGLKLDFNLADQVSIERKCSDPAFYYPATPPSPTIAPINYPVCALLLDWIERTIPAPFLPLSPNRVTHSFFFFSFLPVPPLLSHSYDWNHQIDWTRIHTIGITTLCSLILADWEDSSTKNQRFLNGQKFEQFDLSTQLLRAIKQSGPTGRSLELKDRLRRMKGAADDARTFQATATSSDEFGKDQTRQWLIPWQLGLTEEDDVRNRTLKLEDKLCFQEGVLIGNVISFNNALVSLLVYC